jgi:predicted restriction endonuclease
LEPERKIFLLEEIQELHNKMLLIKPERKIQEITRLIRNDRKIVNVLKELVGYKCQFPDCNSYIPNKHGTNYVEVAHIKPIYLGGQSIIGNLIVLCPNHHKEFDLVEPTIIQQNEYIVSGILNGKNFKINLDNNYSYTISK